MSMASIRTRRVLAIALLCTASGFAGAQVQQVYGYLDVEGMVVYSDKPQPAGSKVSQAKRVTAKQ